MEQHGVLLLRIGLAVRAEVIAIAMVDEAAAEVAIAVFLSLCYRLLSCSFFILHIVDCFAVPFSII